MGDKQEVSPVEQEANLNALMARIKQQISGRAHDVDSDWKLPPAGYTSVASKHR